MELYVFILLVLGSESQNLIAKHLSVQVSTSEPESPKALVDEDEAEAGPVGRAPDAVTTTYQLGDKVTIKIQFRPTSVKKWRYNLPIPVLCLYSHESYSLSVKRLKLTLLCTNKLLNKLGDDGAESNKNSKAAPKTKVSPRIVNSD